MFTKGAVTWITAVRRNEKFQYFKLIISFKLYPTILRRAITKQAAHVSILRSLMNLMRQNCILKQQETKTMKPLFDFMAQKRNLPQTNYVMFSLQLWRQTPHALFQNSNTTRCKAMRILVSKNWRQCRDMD